MTASPQLFLNGRVTLHVGDCLAVLRTLPDASVDSVVTDPPYHLTSMVKRFGAAGAAPARAKQTGAYERASRGFMGQTWDGGDIAFRPELWAEVLRVLKPGGHMTAFSGTRTYHRMACAIEDAGFEIRDQLAWAYGSGFPKSHDVAKGIDKAAGAVREVVGEGPFASRRPRADHGSQGLTFADDSYVRPAGHPLTAPATDAARQWAGWGTALKPAWEPICLARKPLAGTVVETVLAHGTGALNIDGCRVHADDAQGGAYTVKRLKPGATLNSTGGNWRPEEGGVEYHGEMKPGRWPANLVHDGSPEVLEAFPDTGISSGGKGEASQRTALAGHVYGEFSGSTLGRNAGGLGDAGSAARFFYTAKADADDRIGSKHPTVKPVDLMQWLVRLITPMGGLVLDLFAGTGTTGEAAWREGCRAVLIEREAEYAADIARRMQLALAGPDERKAKITAASGRAPQSAGPLFAMLGEAAE